MRIVDLSAAIEPSPEGTMPAVRTDIEYINHQTGAGQIQALFGVPPTLLRDNEGWAVEIFTRFGTHDSTHVDAPWHYNSRIQGQRAATIDELPLDWFFSDGVVIDMSAKDDGDSVSVADLEQALAAIDYALKPRDIVLIRTGRDAFYGRPDYVFRGCGVSAAATQWLFDQGIRVMGIDAWGWDAPLDRQAREAIDAGRGGVFWAAHQANLPYAQIERLVNLAALPPHGFKVICFPLKVKGGSAGPTRAVALLSED